MTKPTKWHLRPAKTDQTRRIRLGIRPVWPGLRCPHEASLHWMHSEDSDQTGRMPMLIWVFARLWSDWADAHSDLNLHWALKSFCWFSHGAALLCRSSKLQNQSYTMFKEKEQYPKSTLCMFLFRLVLFAEPRQTRVNVRIVLNHRRCPRAMSSRYNVWNSSFYIINCYSYQKVLYGFGIGCWYIKTPNSING